MNLLSLYHFFAGKASDKQKEAIKLSLIHI